MYIVAKGKYLDMLFNIWCYMVCCSNSVQQGFNEKTQDPGVGKIEEGTGNRVLPKT